MKRTIIKIFAIFIISTFIFNSAALAVDISSTETINKNSEIVSTKPIEISDTVSLSADDSSAETIGKISENVSAKLIEMSDNDKISVYVYFRDTSEEVMSTMATKHADLFAVYTATKEKTSANLNTSHLTLSNDQQISSENDTNLQTAIQTKRELYKSHYSANNTELLTKYCDNESILYVSSYAPMAIIAVTKNELKQLICDSSITHISLFENEMFFNSSLENSNLTSRAGYVRDNYGNKGNGVKIGQVELAVPDTSDSYLSSANIITNTSFGGEQSSDNIKHAIYVARIMVGSTGLAPSASLYSASANSTVGFMSAIDWLISQGVNVINMSANNYGQHDYDELCAYIDHIAIQHDVHFVVSAGNIHPVDPTLYVCSPGLAYNAITIGAYNDNSTAPIDDSQIYSKQKDDFIHTHSKYLEYPTSNRPCKPNLVASGNNFWDFELGGTSFAAPQVTGVIAQLCSYRSYLKTQQTCMGAILAASCGRKLASEVQPGSEIVTSTAFKGGKFISDTSIFRSKNQISDIEGAGKLDAYWARLTVATGNYWSLHLDASTTIYTQNVYIAKESNTLTRVALYWLKRNFADSQNNITQVNLPDWDLKVYGPDGSLVASSSTYYSNYEIVQFVPPTSGTYQIEIRRITSPFTEKSNIGIAVW